MPDSLTAKAGLSSVEVVPCTRRWRPRFLQMLLLGSILYAALMLGWLIRNMHSANSQANSVPMNVEILLEKVHRPVANVLQKVKNKVNEIQRTPSPEELKAVVHAQSVPNLPGGQLQWRNLTCIGWRATDGCRPDGPRNVLNDLSCEEEVPEESSGYCEAINAVRNALAPGLSLPNIDPKQVGQDGIIMVVYPKLIASAYATIRTLRDVLGCRLPIEIWFRQDEINRVPRALSPLHQLALNDTMGKIVFREIDDPQAVRFSAKVFALYNSGFDRTIFLDADNVPVRDPTYMFKSPEFKKMGAIFWPDYWHPHYTIFYLHWDSLLWELLDMHYVDMFEQESGQLLIDRRRHAVPLELVRFFTFHNPNPIEQLKLLWGDKDLFRLAWIKLSIPFYMVQTPPGVAGTVNGSSFCGMTMVQYDAQGDVLFLHRNAKKLTGEVLYKPVNYHIEARKRIRSKLIKQGIQRVPTLEEVEEEVRKIRKTPPPRLEPAESDGIADPAIWTHLLSFRRTAPKYEYKVKSYYAMPNFKERQRCYGERELARNKYFELQKFTDMSFSGLETHVRRFAMEAAQIRRADNA
ncbi:unnamed protein product [Phytophthora fragariaefolia]|uniref:Unnamed protein product n=1 Tax=Phytophthora fragariaefolia TaxID=1490495 RepID=A0A9W6XRN9_9STRA|nr:unnamed protein product [Phytophthora fragariaefolia]